MQKKTPITEKKKNSVGKRVWRGARLKTTFSGKNQKGGKGGQNYFCRLESKDPDQRHLTNDERQGKKHSPGTF